MIKPGEYRDVRKIKNKGFYEETKSTAIKENVVTTLGCKAQIYMWKKKQASCFVLFLFPPARRRGIAEEEAAAPTFCTRGHAGAVAASASLSFSIMRQRALDGTGKPVTNQDTCHRLTQKTTVLIGGGLLIGVVKG